MSIEYNKGTNPTITITTNTVTLVPTLDETIGEDTVTRYSYVTIRRDPCSEAAIDTSQGELQIKMDAGGEVEDSLGNVFKIEDHKAILKLNRNYTKDQDCGQQYFLQFNLIDTDGNLFAVGVKPFPVKVLPNQAVFDEGNGNG